MGGTESPEKKAGKENSLPSSNSSAKKTPAEWLKAKKKKAYYLPALLQATGWTEDHQVTESEFDRKLNEWLKRPHGKECA